METWLLLFLDSEWSVPCPWPGSHSSPPPPAGSPAPYNGNCAPLLGDTGAQWVCPKHHEFEVLLNLHLGSPVSIQPKFFHLPSPKPNLCEAQLNAPLLKGSKLLPAPPGHWRLIPAPQRWGDAWAPGDAEDASDGGSKEDPGSPERPTA